MKKVFGAALIAAVVLSVTSGIIYASGETSGWFKANEEGTVNSSYTQLTQHLLDFTSSPDEIQLGEGDDNLRFNAGDDFIYMGADDDEISMGYGSDTISFGGGSGSTESIIFDYPGLSSYIRWQATTDNITIRSNSGDVIIQIGN